MPTICKCLELCPGEFIYLAIEVALLCLMADRWLVKRFWSGVEVSEK